MKKRRYAWAVFIGYQNIPGEKAAPFFTIQGIHRQSGSTVDANTLVREGISWQPWRIPSYAHWIKRNR
jgi:hypothetical protein